MISKEQLEKELGFPIDIIKEGETTLLVPSFSSYLREDGVYEPAHAPVFYNPKAKFNRDVAVEVARLYKKKTGSLTVLEPLTGSGVRSVRYAKEAAADFVLASDLNPLAIKLLQLNAELNGVNDRVKGVVEDAHVVLHSKRIKGTYYDIVDIDPFGSPIPFLDGGVRSVKRGGLIAMTATDTAALSGAKPAPALRRYGVSLKRTPFSKEVAIRALISASVRIGAMREVALKPLLSFFKDYYVRVNLRAEKGARRTEESLSKLGYLYLDNLEVKVVEGYPIPLESVEDPRKLIGPIWLGNLIDREFFGGELSSIKNVEVRSFIERLLEEDEIGIPFSYNIESICSYLKRHMPKPKLVAERLRELGFKAVIVHYDYRSLKTNAPLEEVLRIVKELSPT